jgi:hypothetical protein
VLKNAVVPENRLNIAAVHLWMFSGDGEGVGSYTKLDGHRMLGVNAIAPG